MCQSGVNTAQLLTMTTMVEDTLTLSQEWLKEVHHLAGHTDNMKASADIAQASVKVGEVRALLEAACAELEKGEHDHGVTVELV